MSLSMFTKLLTTSYGITGSGYNREGQLDQDNQNDELNVTESKVRDVRFMDRSVYHTVYVLKNGSVKVSGHNGYGQLGLGNNTNVLGLEDLNISDVREVKCGGYFTMFILKDGTIKVTGDNRYGQLGLGHTNNVNTLTTLNLKNVKTISCGGYHTFFLMENGEVYACGSNRNGQLGVGDTTNRLTPVKLNLRGIKDIKCGGEFTYFIMNDGVIKSCGFNGYGQLGLGDFDNRTTPTNVPITHVNKIECASHHTLFLMVDKTVKGCGHNGDGQLGTGETVHYNKIIDVPVKDVANIVVNGYTSLFLINTMLVKGCGHNKFGELGLDDRINRTKVTTLKFINILFDEDLADDIVILPPFDKSKEVFVAEGYFLGYSFNNIYILDRDLVFKVYRREDMQLIHETYFYISRGKIQYTFDKSVVFNEDGSRKFIIDPMYATCNNDVQIETIFDFSINGSVYRYNTTAREVTGLVLKEDSICTTINDNYYIFDGKVRKYNNGNLDNFSANSKLLSSSDMIRINMGNSKRFITNFDKGYFTDDNLSIIKEIDFKDEITSILYCCDRLYVGTRGGFLYNIKDINSFTINDVFRKFDKEICMIKIKDNKNTLNKNLLIDNQGRHLILGFTDGNYKKLPLYEQPDFEIKYDDVNYIGENTYYHVRLRLNNENEYYENMKLMFHDKYDEHRFTIGDLSHDRYTQTIELERGNPGIYTHFRLNYLYGNNSFGSITKKICNIKTHMMYYHVGRLFLNLSNYSSVNCEIALEKVNKDGSVQELQRYDLESGKDFEFLSFDEFSDLEIFNIKLIQREYHYYLFEEVNINDIILNNYIGSFNIDGDILNDIEFLFNRIHENKNLSEFKTDDLVRLLNKLSYKKLGKTERLEDLKLDDSIKNDIYGNSNPFFYNNHHSRNLMNFDVDNIYKDMRYRTNVYINGRKVPFNDVYNLVNTGESTFNTYFVDGNIEKQTNNYVEGVVYQESLIDSENELYTVHIKNWEDVNKLLKGEYYIYLNEISEYVDERKISLYVKFRHGSYHNRITLNSYELVLDEITHSYMKYKLKIKDQVLCQIGNEIHLTISDLEKETGIIFKDNSKNDTKKYKNYFVPLLSLNDRGSIINYYVDKSENVEVFANGYMLTPYVDYKVLNYPMHLQLPSMIVFKKPLRNDIKLEISVLKQNLLEPIVKKSTHNNTTIIDETDRNLGTTFIPLLYNTYDKFVDNLKIPNLDEDGRTSSVYSNNLVLKNYEYIKFYLENNSLVRFLITLLTLKLKEENIKRPSNIGNITKDNYSPARTSMDIYQDDSNEGLLYFVYELFDKSIATNQNILIDCNDEKLVEMDTDILLDSNIKFSLPYITEDIKLDSNHDYNPGDYSNNI